MLWDLCTCPLLPPTRSLGLKFLCVYLMHELDPALLPYPGLTLPLRTSCHYGDKRPCPPLQLQVEQRTGKKTMRGGLKVQGLLGTAPQDAPAVGRACAFTQSVAPPRGLLINFAHNALFQ